MPEFLNTNPHRIYLTAGDDNVRAGAGSTFEAEGALADKAEQTDGVVSADSQEAEDFNNRPLKPGEQVSDPQAEGADERVGLAGQLLQQAGQAAVGPNSDRYVGDPATGAVVQTPIGTPVPNQPTVPFASTGAEVLGPGAGIIPAGPGGGAPAEGGPYEQEAIEDAEGEAGEGLAGPTPLKDVEGSSVVGDVGERGGGGDNGGDYSSQTKSDLVTEAESRGLDSSGTKSDLVERLNNDDSGTTTSSDVPTR